MVYKKYIKRGGKTYGPYAYHSKKIGGKVTTEYLGKHEESKSRKNNSYMLERFAVFLMIGIIFVLGMSILFVTSPEDSNQFLLGVVEGIPGFKGVFLSPTSPQGVFVFPSIQTVNQTQDFIIEIRARAPVGASDIHSIQFDIEYSSSILTFVNITEGTMLNNNSQDVTFFGYDASVPGIINDVYISRNGTTGIYTDEGITAIINFTATNPGSSTINLNEVIWINSTITNDTATQVFDLNLSNGTVIVNSLCGNGIVDTGEQCDTLNLSGNDCTTIPGGYTGGNLSCTGSCTFDVTRCILPPVGPIVSLDSPLNGASNLPQNVQFNASVTVAGKVEIASASLYHNISGIFALAETKYTELPNNQINDIKNNIDMTGNILLLHLNNDSSVGETGTNFYDYSGNGNNGTAQSFDGDEITPNGKFNGAITFDGTDDLIYWNDATFGSVTGLTVSLWFKSAVASPASEQILFYSGSDLGGDLEISYKPSPTFAIRVLPIAGCGNPLVTLTDPMDTNWHHLAYVWDGTNQFLYLDGNQEDTSACASIGSGTGNNPTSIGARNTLTPAHFFDGIEDEVAIWNRGLSPTEVQRLYNVTKDYKFDYTVNNILNGTYEWNVLAVDNESNIDWNANNFTFGVGTGAPSISLPLYSTFNGTTTDFASEADITTVSNAVLESISFGKIEFGAQSLNFNGLDLDSNVFIEDKLIGIDSVNLPGLNVAANITFYNINFVSPIVFDGNQECSDCNILSYVGGNLEVSVTHFSNYTVGTVASLEIGDETDTVTKYPNDAVISFANYTNLSNSQPILGATCNINFGSIDTVMSYNTVNGLYENISSFVSAGTYPYTINCSAIGFDNLELTDGVLISPPAVSCDLTNATWSQINVNNGTLVNMIVTGSNCDGEQINFTVWEDDLFSGNDPPVTQPLDVNFVGSTATGSWQAEYQPDGIGGINDPPEFFYVVTVLSNASETVDSQALGNPLLEVNPPPASGENELYVNPSAQTVNQTDSVIIEIRAKAPTSASDIYSIQYDVLYNSSLLTFANITEGPMLSRAGQDVTYFNYDSSVTGVVKDIYIARNGTTGIYDNDNITVIINFTASNPGSSFINLNNMIWVNSTITNSSVGIPNVIVSNGSVTINLVPICGDGLINTSIGEQCDDANTNPGDGCDSSCQIEDGWTCSGEPSVCSEICGDSLVVGSEQCDTLNLSGESCSTQGYFTGDLLCTDSCTFNVSQCATFSDVHNLTAQLVTPLSDIVVTKNQFFTFTTNVTCAGGDCGTVTAALDPIDVVSINVSNIVSANNVIITGYTPTVGSNRMLIFAVGNEKGGGAPAAQVSTLTFGGVSLSPAHISVFNEQIVEYWYLNESSLPPDGPNDFVIVWDIFPIDPSDWHNVAFTFIGVNQTNPFYNMTSTSAASNNSLADRITPEVGGYVISGVNQGRAPGTTTWTGVTKISDYSGSSSIHSYAINESLTAAEVSAWAQVSSTSDRDMIVASIALSPSSTGAKSGLVSTIAGTIPFYTTDLNPQSCGYMVDGDNCTTTWQVNATGANDTYEFFVTYSSDNISILDEETTHVNVNISIGPLPDNPPTINLNSPADLLNTSQTSIIFNASVSDDNNLINVSLFIDSVRDQTNSSGLNNVDYIFNKVFVDGTNKVFVDGTYVWNYEACDNASQCTQSSTRTLTIDTIPPAWILVPANITLEYLIDSLNVDFDATDSSGIDSYYINWTTSFVINPLTGVLTNTSSLNVGTYLIIVGVNDTVGNSNSLVYRVDVQDTISPYFTVLVNQTLTQGQSLNYDINAVDDGVGLGSFSIDDTINFAINLTTGVVTNITALSINYYQINVSVDDLSGNLISELWSVNVTTVPSTKTLLKI